MGSETNVQPTYRFAKSSQTIRWTFHNTGRIIFFQYIQQINVQNCEFVLYLKVNILNIFAFSHFYFQQTLLSINRHICQVPMIHVLHLITLWTGIRQICLITGASVLYQLMDIKQRGGGWTLAIWAASPTSPSTTGPIMLLGVSKIKF